MTSVSMRAEDILREFGWAGSAVHKAYDLACGLLPEGFREGITNLFRKGLLRRTTYRGAS